jgi:hypothetical protein
MSALPLGKTCSSVLFSDFVKRKREKLKKKHMTL